VNYSGALQNGCGTKPTQKRIILMSAFDDFDPDDAKERDMEINLDTNQCYNNKR